MKIAVTSVLQTSAGRMVFGRCEPTSKEEAGEKEQGPRPRREQHVAEVAENFALPLCAIAEFLGDLATRGRETSAA